MPKSHLCSAALIIALCISGSSSALDNGVARTPPMGWNTFNCLGGDWTPDNPVAGTVNVIMKAITDSLVANGMRDLGYIYVCGDGANGGNAPFWPGYPGFVNWAKPTADYIRGKGMKMGLYSSEFTNPQAIASDLAAANIEFVKIDAWTSSTSDPGWKALADALVATGKKIVYSSHSSQPGITNMQRTGPDIDGTWQSVMQNYDDNYTSLSQARPGTWPDPDMFVIPYLNDNENRAHFSMWCMMASPLIMGYNLSRLAPTDYNSNTYTFSTSTYPTATHVKAMAIFSNAELIALDQDTIGLAGHRIKGQGALEVWVKNCADGAKAVALFNRTGTSASMSITQTELGLGTGTIYVRDLWLHADQPTFTGTFTKTVASHAAEVYKMDIKPITQPTATLQKMDRAIAWMRMNGYDPFPQRLLPAIITGSVPGVKAFDVSGRAFMSSSPLSLGQIMSAVRGEKARNAVLPLPVK